MKWKKSLAALAAVTLASLSLAACGGSSSNDPAVKENPKLPAGSTMEKLNKAQKITIGVKFDQPLFGQMGPDGKPVGFDIEIGKIIAADLGIPADKVQWVETVSQNREPFIQNGQVDLVIATYTINDKRKKVISFAGPYYVAGQTFLVPKGNPKGISADPVKLDNATICTVVGSTSETNVKKHTQKVMTVDKYSDCLEPIRNGQADALTTDNVILAGLVDQSGDEFELVDGTFTSEPYGIGLKKDDADFRNWIDDTLEASYKDGRWEKAWKDTAGKILDTPKPPAVERY